MKDSKNQYLSTGATIVVLSFLGTMTIFLLAPKTTQDGENDKIQSYQKAKSIGQTIVMRLKEESTKSPSRKIASTNSSESQGYMGIDEKGEPYHYSVLQTDAGVARIVVRSGGPKGRIEYAEEGGREMPVPAELLPKPNTSNSY